MTKMQPYTNQWHDIAAAMQRSFAPPVYPCGTCGYPVIKGYCCTNCHSMNPQDKPEPGTKHE
jgi:hypothetical protein